MTGTHANFTGSIPEIYDAHLGPFLFEFSAKDLADRVKDSIPPDGKILKWLVGQAFQPITCGRFYQKVFILRRPI